ncbi:MAG: DUF4384 domain-containing protein [Pseudomonadota bacterium]
MQRSRPAIRPLAAAAVLALALVPTLARSADYALIMGIGNYQERRANLPGIDKDMAAARRIAQSIGVPAANIRELSDGQVTGAGVGRALQEMEAQLRPGDRAFVYYSGHGSQEPNAGGGARCTEGMFVHDMKMFADFDLESALARIAARAGQLIMFNDSCFSGGAATKAPRSEGVVPKFFQKSVAERPGYTCGDAINMKASARNLVAGAAAKGNNMVYIAASADDEVAMATPKGSAATLAWESCLKNPATDTNSSGSLSAAELMRCAQGQLKAMGHNQTISLIGNEALPVSFAAAPAQSAPPSQPDAVRRSAATLEDIRQAASAAIQVELQPSRGQLRIGQDPLDFTVRTSRAGYLYLLHVGPDGRTFDLLFPNQYDQNNFVQPGTVQLPRPSWRVMAAGPAGDAHVLAIVSDVRKDFTRPLADKQGPFSSGSVDNDTQNKLRVEATGVGSSAGSGQFGASRVVRVREVQ